MPFSLECILLKPDATISHNSVQADFDCFLFTAFFSPLLQT